MVHLLSHRGSVVDLTFLDRDDVRSSTASKKMRRVDP
jgi:hypothetical protein